MAVSCLFGAVAADISSTLHVMQSSLSCVNALRISDSCCQLKVLKPCPYRYITQTGALRKCYEQIEAVQNHLYAQTRTSSTHASSFKIGGPCYALHFCGRLCNLNYITCLLLLLLATVAGWFRTKRPKHCGHFLTYCDSPSDF
jgi:hypothetical protein